MTSPDHSFAPTGPATDQPLEINHEILLAATRDLAADQPILMLNLLRYREKADYGPHSAQAPRSGREAYQDYIKAFLAHNSPHEAKVFFQGPALAALVAPRGEHWDEIALVEYRDLAVFRRWIEHPAYAAEAAPIRRAALADWRLLMTLPPIG